MLGRPAAQSKIHLYKQREALAGMSISNLGYIYSLSTLVFVTFSLIIAVRFLVRGGDMVKYFGAAWLFMTSGWWGTSIGVLVFLSTGYGLPPRVHIGINKLFVPVAVGCWIRAYLMVSGWKDTKIRRWMLGIWSALAIYDAINLALLIIDPSYLGSMNSPIDMSPTLVPTGLFQTFASALVLVTGYAFAYKTYKMNRSLLEFRGLMLFLAFTAFVAGTLPESLLTNERLGAFGILITRALLLLCSVSFYVAFFTPSFIASRFED
jgi:hypothetical protein